MNTREVLSRRDWDGEFTTTSTADSLIELPLEAGIRNCWTVVAAVAAEGAEYVIPGLHAKQLIVYITTEQEWSDEDLLETWYWVEPSAKAAN